MTSSLAGQTSKSICSRPSSPCTGLSLIGVRGSTEPQSGSGLLKPIGTAISQVFPDRTSYVELEYPATIERFDPPADIDLGQSPSQGVRSLVTLLNESAMRHPDRCFVLLGYSQGAQVIGDALVSPEFRICGQEADEVSQHASDRIASITLFGDPRFTKGEPFNAGTFYPEKDGLYPRPREILHLYASRLQNYCARNDVTCQGSGGNLQAHFEYFKNAMPHDAVRFVVRRITSERCVA